MNKFSRLKDISQMQFGKYKGEDLQDVPGSYLIWLEGELNKKTPDQRTLFENSLKIYISENRDGIEEESKRRRELYKKRNGL